ncbi:MAG TPA: macro domain-containing protein [Pyrinomonadaceae bacterium]|nr:macro domain-containing protein [Pyrinomonadaceae bacterium]
MGNKRTYLFGKSCLALEFGDITTSKAQVLVSSDDYYLSMGGGVSRSLLMAGGNVIALDAAKKVPAALGDVVVTTAGTLPAQYIFHAVTIGPDNVTTSSQETVKQTTKRCMQMLDTLQLCSIAFPAIGAGVAEFSYEDVAAQMSEVIADDLLKRRTPVEVTIYLFDRFGEMREMDFIRFFEEFAARVPRLASHAQSPCCEDSTSPAEELLVPYKDSMSEDVSETNQEIKMRRVHNLRKLINALEEQRYKLEERLIILINAEEDQEMKKLRQKLHENEELRLGYLNELKTLSEKDSLIPQKVNFEKKHLSVFLSSTYKDLLGYRNAVKDQITRRDMLFRGMEHFGADPNGLAPATKIVYEVRKTDVYLGIFGVRYGFVDQATGLSMTELEFNEAEASVKPMLLYIIRDDAQIKVSDIETDPNSKVKLDNFKARILKRYVPYMFDTIEDLARQVYEDLGKL